MQRGWPFTMTRGVSLRTVIGDGWGNFTAMKPSFKYWFFIMGITCVIFGVILASVVGSWLNLTAAEQGSVAGLAEKLLPFPLLGAIILVVVIGGLVSLLFHYYIIPILQMAESTQLISLANLSHRIPPRGAREVVHLTGVINASADAYQKLRTEVDVAIHSAQADLKEEHNRFVALMSELPWGVVVCNTDGLILLYNQQAQALLQPPKQSKFTENRTEGLIGLGRSVFGVLPRDTVVNGLELLQQSVSLGQAMPTSEFMTTLAWGRILRITMALSFSFHCEVHEECVQCEQRQMAGFVLTLEDVTPPTVQAEFATPTGPRPVYYEFDLFNQRGLPELSTQQLGKLTFVVFDTETTGLNPTQGDEIIQIGAVRIINGRILRDELIDQLIDPNRSLPEASVAIHGITSDMLVGRPTIGQVLPHFHRFAEGAVLVAHNAAFDMRCLQVKEGQTGVRFDNPVLDTLLLSSVIHPHQECHSLEGIARRLNLTITGRHTALGDALVTAEVMLKLIPLLEARGILTLEDALHASKNSRYAKLKY